MQIVGGLLAVVGVLALVACVREIDSGGRPRDVAFAILAPMAVVLTLTGLLLIFVPGFL